MNHYNFGAKGSSSTKLSRDNAARWGC